MRWTRRVQLRKAPGMTERGVCEPRRAGAGCAAGSAWRPHQQTVASCRATAPTPHASAQPAASLTRGGSFAGGVRRPAGGNGGRGPCGRGQPRPRPRLSPGRSCRNVRSGVRAIVRDPPRSAAACRRCARPPRRRSAGPRGGGGGRRRPAQRAAGLPACRAARPARLPARCPSASREPPRPPRRRGADAMGACVSVHEQPCPSGGGKPQQSAELALLHAAATGNVSLAADALRRGATPGATAAVRRAALRRARRGGLTARGLTAALVRTCALPLGRRRRLPAAGRRWCWPRRTGTPPWRASCCSTANSWTCATGCGSAAQRSASVSRGHILRAPKYIAAENACGRRRAERAARAVAHRRMRAARGRARRRNRASRPPALRLAARTIKLEWHNVR
jgi:hypothetical protein